MSAASLPVERRDAPSSMPALPSGRLSRIDACLRRLGTKSDEKSGLEMECLDRVCSNERAKPLGVFEF
jgi:hypothetical protein